MFAGISEHEMASALDAAAHEAIEAAGIARPPVSAIELASSRAMTVALDRGQCERARLVRLKATGDGGSIFLRPEPRSERRQWAVAHELGELLAHRVFDALGVDPREAARGAREAIANQLASRLLLPSMWFFDDARQFDWDLLRLKERYATASHELIVRRMLDGPRQIVISIFDRDRMNFRRGNWSFRAPPITPAETTCQQTVHRTGSEETVFDGLRRVQGWPVHEQDWKREILRLECEEDLEL